MAGMAMDHGDMKMPDHHHPMGAGVANVAMNPVSRLHEPGLGLEGVPHRTLSYAQLRSLRPNTERRPPEREVEIHLTSNMERYMWSFDGVKFSEVEESIKFYEGERVRLTLVNDTMMPHPIHLHGMFFDLVIPDYDQDEDGERYLPGLHTILTKPGEKLSVDITPPERGDWAFHCHLLYHMHAGMMQVVSVLPHHERPPLSEIGAGPGRPIRQDCRAARSCSMKRSSAARSCSATALRTPRQKAARFSGRLPLKRAMARSPSSAIKAARRRSTRKT